MQMPPAQGLIFWINSTASALRRPIAFAVSDARARFVGDEMPGTSLCRKLACFGADKRQDACEDGYDEILPCFTMGFEKFRSVGS